MEYDQGNDMMARQMYSEKSRAAVLWEPPISYNPIVPGRGKTYLLPTASAILDGILRFHFNLATDALGCRRRVDGRHMVMRQTAAPALDIVGLELRVLQLGALVTLVAQFGGAVVVPSASSKCCVVRPSHFNDKERANRA